MLETKFGPMAQDGDYVVVVDFNYMKRSCNTYVARVYRDKAYTGIKIPGTDKYVHKLRAECVIPVSYVSEESNRMIQTDIAIHNPDTVRYDMERGVFYMRI
jgi:hypothetical protein